MFWREKRSPAELELEVELARTICACAQADATITKLTRDLREMDQLVYQMAQSGFPEQLRQAVAKAWAITEKRMQAESKRINDLLIPEVVKTYANHETQQPLAKADQRLITKGKS